MFTGELISYQIGVANKLCARKKMLVGMPQGTGKTVISLACAEKLLEIGSIRHVLILAPQGICWQWKDKIEEFTTNDGRLIEAKSKQSRDYKTHKSVYTIVPYSVFRKDYKGLLSLKYDLIIADEAQEFSSFRSKTFKLIKKFRAPYRWALTGTAISNKLEELYAILQWVDPYLLPYWSEFEKHHIIRNPNTGAVLKYKNLESLNKYLLATRLERKTLDELKGSLPELISYKVYVDKDEEVRDSESNLLGVLSNSNLASSSFAFDPDISQALHRARKAVVSEKKLTKAMELISTCLSESENNRVVVFGFYKEPLYELYSRLGNSASLFTGNHSAAEKQASVRLFKDSTKVLICSDAGKAGLDLPFANYTIHLDVPYSFSTFDQRSKRTQRTSSTFSSVVVIYLLVKDSIDEYYYQVTINKGKLSTAAQEGGSDTVVMKEQSLKDYLDDIRTKDSGVARVKEEPESS